MRLFKPFNPNQVFHLLDQYFQRSQAKNILKPIQIRIYSQKLDMDYSFPSNADSKPFHTASIGKIFTAVLVQMLVEKGVLLLNDRIQSFFTCHDLDRLFIYRGIDYASKVTIKDLLGHTSGIADYFEGKTTSGVSFVENLVSNSQTYWTPKMLLDFTRNNQKALNIPGRDFNYSDTGYILLGLIIEAVKGISFAKNLEDNIFAPLNMKDSYMMFHSQPKNLPEKNIEQIWFDNLDISGFKSLSSDWSGGGVISTTTDLLLFSQALHRGQLIKRETLETMCACFQKFRSGIYYGLGIMEIHFEKFSFLLRDLPRIKGHTGIFSTHMFYDLMNDAHIIMNFGCNKRMGESFRALIEIETVLHKLGIHEG